VLTDAKPVNTLGNLGVLARLLDSRTEIGVSQRDAVSIAARGIDNLAGRDGTVSLNPVAPPPPVGGGRVSDLLAIAASRCWREFSHCERRAGMDSLGGDCIKTQGLLISASRDRSASLVEFQSTAIRDF
jgi:hypothetical protein